MTIWLTDDFQQFQQRLMFLCTFTQDDFDSYYYLTSSRAFYHSFSQYMRQEQDEMKKFS